MNVFYCQWTCVHDIQESQDLGDDDSTMHISDVCRPSLSTSDSVLPPCGMSSGMSNSTTEHLNCSNTSQVLNRHNATPDSGVDTASTPRHEVLAADTETSGRNHQMTYHNVALSGWESVTHNSDGHRLATNCHASSLHPIHVRGNRPRLTHYIEEPNVGRGFIKEISFNHDGRLICSPFGFGVRLLAFSDSCSELCDCVPTSPVQLYEVTSNITHSSVVVTTKFSPTHGLVSGCLDGKVDFHQPVL